MTSDKFDASGWVDRLAEKLDTLAHSITAHRINQPTLTNDQYRALAEAAIHDAEAHILFEEYLPKLNSDPSAAILVLRTHPIIQRALDASTDDTAIMMNTPNKGFRVELERLVLYLIKSSVKGGGHNAANTLQKYLELSDKNLLPGHEITLFRGLLVNQHLDIGKGIFIAPYSEVVELGLLRERKTVPWENAPDYRKMGVAALVRDLTWGPGITSAMTSSTPFSAHIPDVVFPYLDNRENLEVILDFLSIVTRSELGILSVQYCGAKFMEDIDPNFACSPLNGFIEDFWWRLLPAERTLDTKEVGILSELLCKWMKNHEIPNHAVRRLASSVSRKGQFWLHDSILDLSIALESIYQSDQTELSYKLATRAGYFLGSDPEQRKRIFNCVRKFYKVRSKIVHGKETSTKELKETFEDGFALACNTLFKSLSTGYPCDWDKLVMTGIV